MWNNGSLYPIQGKFVDDSVATVVPKGSTWARCFKAQAHYCIL